MPRPCSFDVQFLQTERDGRIFTRFLLRLKRTSFPSFPFSQPCSLLLEPNVRILTRFLLRSKRTSFPLCRPWAKGVQIRTTWMPRPCSPWRRTLTTRTCCVNSRGCWQWPHTRCEYTPRSGSGSRAGGQWINGCVD
jgi:hypothetical protein